MRGIAGMGGMGGVGLARSTMSDTGDNGTKYEYRISCTSCTTINRAAKSLTALLVLPGKVQQGHYGYNGPVAPVLCYMIMMMQRWRGVRDQDAHEIEVRPTPQRP